MNDPKDTLQSHAARLLARKQAADSRAAEKVAQDNLEQERLKRIASAGEVAAIRLGAMLNGLKCHELGLRLALHWSRDKAGPQYVHLVSGWKDDDFRDPSEILKTSHVFDPSSNCLVASFGVGWSQDGRECWLTHDDDHIAYEVAAGIILDLLERRMP
jgi:hypothetical protein